MALRLILENAAKDVLLIRVRGVIDLATAPQWEELVRRVIRRRTSVVIVDVSHLEYVSARGLKMLLALAANQSLLHGCLIISGARGGTRRAAQMVGLWELAAVVSSVRAALQKAEDHRTACDAAKKLLKEACSSSRRMAKQVGE